MIRSGQVRSDQDKSDYVMLRQGQVRLNQIKERSGQDRQKACHVRSGHISYVSSGHVRLSHCLFWSGQVKVRSRHE